MSAPDALGSLKTGGRATCSASSLRWLPLAAAAFSAELAVIYVVGPSGQGASMLPVLLPLAHLLLLPFLIRNLAFWGVRLMLLGLALNLTAMLANGGLMPVAPAAVQAIGKHDINRLQPGDPIPGSKNVLLEPGQTRARWLSDAIVLPVPRPYKRAVSAGDLVVATGVAVTLFEVIRRSREATAGR